MLKEKAPVAENGFLPLTALGGIAPAAPAEVREVEEPVAGDSFEGFKVSEFQGFKVRPPVIWAAFLFGRRLREVMRILSPVSFRLSSRYLVGIGVVAAFGRGDASGADACAENAQG